MVTPRIGLARAVLVYNKACCNSIGLAREFQNSIYAKIFKDELSLEFRERPFSRGIALGAAYLLMKIIARRARWKHFRVRRLEHMRARLLTTPLKRSILTPSSVSWASKGSKRRMSVLNLSSGAII